MLFDVLQDWENKWLDPDYDFSLYDDEEEEDDDIDFLYDQFEGKELEANQ